MTQKYNFLNNSPDFIGMIPKHKHSNSPIRETMKQAGYRYIAFEPFIGYHILEDIDSGKKEKWISNKHHAGYGIIYKNTHLEFVSSVF